MAGGVKNLDNSNLYLVHLVVIVKYWLLSLEKGQTANGRYFLVSFNSLMFPHEFGYSELSGVNTEHSAKFGFFFNYYSVVW